jgi:hypothetical protein
LPFLIKMLNHRKLFLQLSIFDIKVCLFDV